MTLLIVLFERILFKRENPLKLHCNMTMWINKLKSEKSFFNFLIKLKFMKRTS